MSQLFDGFAVFCAVVEEGGFTAAARRLGHSVSHVSKEVARLEARLGTRLLNRTTRTISLTESGGVFFGHARQIVRDAEAIGARMQSLGNEPAGLIRISAAVMFADSCLYPWLPEFLEHYPDVTCDIESSDRRADIVGEGLDVVIRAGRLEDADLVARELMTTRQVTVAAPDYLAAAGEPTTPADLANHALIDFAYRRLAHGWEFVTPQGKPATVPVEPRVTCNSPHAETALAAAGLGITRLPALACEKELREGALVPILTDYEKPPLGIYAVYPSRAYLAPKVRAFIDFFAEKCRAMSSSAGW